MRSTPLIEALENRRWELHLTSRAFAARLGIPEKHWSRLKAGKHEVGLETLRRITAEFPDLAPLAVALFLTPDSTSVESESTNAEVRV
jgi:predicted transcriptional regulator